VAEKGKKHPLTKRKTTNKRGKPQQFICHQTRTSETGRGKQITVANSNNKNPKKKGHSLERRAGPRKEPVEKGTQGRGGSQIK